MTKLKVRTASDAYLPDPVVKAIELLGRGSVIAFRSSGDGYAEIYISGIDAGQAVEMLKRAGIEAIAFE